MNRSNVNILFSLLSGVALFLVIAYSAVRTIDSSQPDNYYVVSQGVDFHDGILNAPTQSTYAQYDQADMSIREYSPENNSYTASNVELSNESRRSELANSSGGTGSINQSGKSYASNSGATTVALNSGSHKDAATQDAAGITVATSSLTTDGSLSGSATRQSVKKTGDNFGGTDIGGDPTGPPIPVGDGLLFLLFLIGIYSLWKSSAKIKQRLTAIYFNLFSLKNKNVRV